MLPDDWNVSGFGVDWGGEPLLLLQEGKPPCPNAPDSEKARIAWLRTAPKAHHLVYWSGLSACRLTFEASTGIFTHFVQPFEGGWLLCEARGGRACVYDSQGSLQRILDLGDAIKDVQTTSLGKIWASYFDEGVYGDGVGKWHGLICFDAFGSPIFTYGEFAERNNLPFIDDCYAMNVVSDDEIWVSYYQAFPLVRIKGFELAQHCEEFGCMRHGFAIVDGGVIFPKCYTRSELLRRKFAEPMETESLEPVDEAGAPIGGVLKVAARGDRFYLWAGNALYQMEWQKGGEG